jgi:hypothetical protein
MYLPVIAKIKLARLLQIWPKNLNFENYFFLDFQKIKKWFINNRNKKSRSIYFFKTAIVIKIQKILNF